ncbi:unnamed protein product [Vitrella brassicaformis CCMP3155]|uniref:DNA-directed RNA polymerase subunit beta n=2 Tax=Vitrella brassicaformis TaxID=1169539 RepID=A0A0G4ERR5_VITBC|nr:unnamed protein product [Vitrella brassicaformis CCMP3155]|eukprot:CEM00582.1 unnamed protein product [Vitrella brassicaformis CCMP3155]
MFGKRAKRVRFSLPEEDDEADEDMQHEGEDQPSVFQAARPISDIGEKWNLLPAFLQARGLVKQHIDSYNHFVNVEMKEIVRAKSNCLVTSEADAKFYLKYTNVHVGVATYSDLAMSRETLTPMKCRIRDITYSAPILVDVEYIRGNQIVVKRHAEIGRLPIMLRSCICVLHGKSHEAMQQLGECPYDPGGYFIIKGTEKVILMQEQLSKNRIIVETDPKHNVCAVVTSATTDNKSRTMVVHKNNRLYMRHSTFTEDIPITIVLKAMGMETDQEIVQMVGTKRHHYEGLSLSIQDAHNASVLSQHAALIYLGQRLKYRQRTAYQRSTAGASATQAGAKSSALIKAQQQADEALEALHRLVLSHIETSGSDFGPKLRFLCLMVRRVLDAVVDRTLMDDKDYYGNKRLELAGQLIALLFEDLFKRFNSDIKRQADQMLSKYHQSLASSSKARDSIQPPDIFRSPPTDLITRGMQHAISSGNWNIKRFKMERTGVAQVLSRLSYIAALGMMTRVNSQFEKSRKVSGPRALQPSQWGMLCPCDTPEGESCGLVKNLSLMTHVTQDENAQPLQRLCISLGVEDAGAIGGEELHSPGTYLVFLNGLLMGVHRRPKQFMKNLRTLRRRGKVGEFVSVYDNEAHRAIYIASDGGRLCRPLIIVDRGKPTLTGTHLDMLRDGQMNFDDFLRTGILEWIDVNEENNLLIALRETDIERETTHLEIDPLTIMGVVSGLIPYPHHNQSPRNTYQCAMGKQAMGAIATNQFARCDTLLYLLVYPQKPLCKTKTIELINFEKLPAGQNASVAIMSYSAYDIEDAIIMNRASLDRGFGRCYVLRRYSTPLSRYSNGTQDRVFPPPQMPAQSRMLAGGRKHARTTGVPRKFDILDDDGVCRVGEMVQDGQIYINKYSPTNTREARIDLNKVDPKDFKPTPVTYRTTVPSYVDRVILTTNDEDTTIYKVILRQTRRPELGDKFSSRHGQKGVVGLIVNQEDMPFNDAGFCPDLIMNPHGFPSRMTVGKMIELIAGKSALCDGKFKYGTAFGGTSVKDIGEILISYGFSYSGKEYLTSGVTGEALSTYIFVGPVYYQKLKHMVQDKMHARGRGPRQILTRQPTEGRSKEGGLRLGEMERDCLVAYGASNLLMERLMISSDIFEASVCRECGLIGYAGWCPYCKSGEKVAAIKMPYACKLLFQELQSMNVCPKLRLKAK